MKKKTREEAIEELSLMLMYLTRFSDDDEYCRYMEMAWKSYDFGALNALDQKELIFQPRSSRGYSKYAYLTESGKARARALLEEYDLADQELYEAYEFRGIRAGEADQAAQIEAICFPQEEACKPEIMRARVQIFPENFLVAVSRETGKLVGFINGLSTDEINLRDEFYKDPKLHVPSGENMMILGVDVLPEYRKQGIAREMMYNFLRRENDRNRRFVILTCLSNKVKMYKKFGFRDYGEADSSWGGKEWHEMVYVLN